MRRTGRSGGEKHAPPDEKPFRKKGAEERGAVFPGSPKGEVRIGHVLKGAALGKDGGMLWLQSREH